MIFRTLTSFILLLSTAPTSLLVAENLEQSPRFSLAPSEEAIPPTVEYSPLKAGLLNLIPSAGFFYTESYGWAAAQLSILAIGAGLVVAARLVNDPEVDVPIGSVFVPPALGALGIGYLGGLIVAPIVASSKNSARQAGSRYETDSPSASDTYGLSFNLHF